MSRDRTSEEYRPLRYLGGGVLIGQDEAWAGFSLRTHPYDLLSNAAKVEHRLRLTWLLDKLVGREGHLIVASRSWPVAERLAALAAQTPRPTEGWLPLLEQMHARLVGQQLHRREVYLLVKLDDAQARDGLGSLTDTFLRWFGQEDPRARTWEVSGLQGEVGKLFSQLNTPGLGLRLATDPELRWLMQRVGRRGRLENEDVPPPADRPAWGGDLEALLEETAEDCGRHVRLGDAIAGYGYAATLSFAHLPVNGPQFPGQAEILHAIDLLEVPPEASFRFRVLTPDQAAKDVHGSIKAARDMMEHTAELGIADPRDVQETLLEATDLEHDIRRNRLPLVHATMRLIVSGPDEETLGRRVAEAISLFRDMGYTATRSAGDQWALFLESVPGDRMRGRYLQKIETTTLAGTMPCASGELGDGEGPYIGITTGPSRQPVLFSPMRAAREDSPTGVAYVGSPG
ncbi:MAG TPA: hypothetical protein VH208_07335, partial [Myxococcaceae bacterium]|nr:hypothetical protein [Myxococcaceae bacterium]